jgi:SAM-dependent methyltransferase
MDRGPAKRFLNAGSGPPVRAMHAAFDPVLWTEVRIDIDPSTTPDLIGSIADMQGVVEDASFDAVWCSHCIEHLHDHEVLPALREFKRILNDEGFAILGCPNFEAVARIAVSEDIESVAYLSPAGPVRLLDMVFGHSPSIKDGSVHMAHRTGFTVDRLGRLAAKAGFEARVLEGENYDLWAALTMPKSDHAAIAYLLQDSHIAALLFERSLPPSATHDAARRKRVRILRT